MSEPSTAKNATSTGTSQWQRYCQYLYHDDRLGLTLDVSRMKFNEDFLLEMAERLRQAMQAMHALERGALANPDEQRQVGHYWLRQPELAPQTDENLGEQIRTQIAAVKDFAQQVHSGQIQGAGGPFQHLLLVGIGGSMLGPQFLIEALAEDQPPLQPHYLDNTDPEGIRRTLARLQPVLNRTLVIITSKSGGTPETRNAMVEAEATYAAAGLSFAEHAVAITGSGSKLDERAATAGWRLRFPMWDWVGGRTSVMSSVGLLPLALLGINIDSFLQGAADMDQATRELEVKQNPAALLALMWYVAGMGQGEKDMVILPYKDRLALFSKYLQQLVMESLGKERNRAGEIVHQGIAVYGNKGSTDQHSYVQQLRDGIPNFFVTFIEVLADGPAAVDQVEVEPGITSGDYLNAFLQGTRLALAENGRESITITVDQVDPHRLGGLIALYERAVGLYAELVHINAYHQPGVEAGKKAAAKILDLQTRALAHLKTTGQPTTASELAEQLQAAMDVELIYKALRHAAANPQHPVRFLPSSSPQQHQFQWSTSTDGTA